MRKYNVLAAVLLVAGFVLAAPAQTWTIEQVTNNTEPDTNAFAAVVSSGLMIGYTHFDGDAEVFYASNFSGSWTTSRITDNTREDVGIDIAARYNEQTARISIYWLDTPDWEISFCSGSPGSWDIDRVTDNANNDGWPSLAIDKSNHTHMAYFGDDGSDLEVFYTNNVTGSWVIEQVTDNGSLDALPWIALDSDDNPNIVYTDGTHLLFTKKVAGIWTAPEEVASGVIFPTVYPFLTLDSDDNCHVVFAKSDGPDFEIYYANNVTGSWQEAKVTSNDYPDAYPTLLIDPHGKIHIAYITVEAADPEVFYANNTAGVWTTSRITDNSAIDIAKSGRYFVADQSGIGHIFFSNNSDGDFEIYHAYSNSPIFAGVEETAPKDLPISITLSSVLSTTVNYSAPKADNVSLKVYDASGSLVKTLVKDLQSQGEHTVTWNGFSDAGVRAAPGVYFYRLITAGQTVSVKGVLN
ncbi:T9SS type A sorting domain-containing protein [candidate division WOR-3 bacterium]|nr:T9SS type A sorting domain-containing protein [candidate division WOR-3 bacterium]